MGRIRISENLFHVQILYFGLIVPLMEDTPLYNAHLFVPFWLNNFDILVGILILTLKSFVT